MIGLATAAAFVVGNGEPLVRFPWVLLAHSLVGTVLVGSGAGTLNQVILRKFDAQIRRTSRRMIAAGRIEPIHALFFGMLLSLVGCTYLALAVRPVASLLAVLTLVCHLFLYTPLKTSNADVNASRRTFRRHVCFDRIRLCGREAQLTGMAFYGILFLWQFPHFMAIAWICRKDYARAGYEALPRGREKALSQKFIDCSGTLNEVTVTWLDPMCPRAAPGQGKM